MEIVSINWIPIVIVAVAIILLISFILIRNRKDKRDLTEELNHPDLERPPVVKDENEQI